jgi:hypothetical protein
MTVVITNNSELFNYQLTNISINIDKCFAKLNDLWDILQKNI